MNSVASKLLALPFALALLACSDDGQGTTEQSDSTGDGDGDQTTTGDGDGDPGTTGDGDGDPTTTGDGDPTTTGDGDGDPTCIPGELDCECNNGLCLADFECVNGICVDGCIPGELGCECNNGQCLGDMICEAGVCAEAPPECPNANEAMCNGECIDVQNNDWNCGSCGNVCPKSFNNLVGGCDNFECLPYWGECFDPNAGFTTCDEACASEGKTCLEWGCGYGFPGDTVAWYFSLSQCEGGDNGDAAPVLCNEPFPWQGNWARCCCG